MVEARQLGQRCIAHLADGAQKTLVGHEILELERGRQALGEGAAAAHGNEN